MNPAVLLQVIVSINSDGAAEITSSARDGYQHAADALRMCLEHVLIEEFGGRKMWQRHTNKGKTLSDGEEDDK